jgi:D-alanyl-D-alanine carboxypeptidase/D-alanyl-D-alanine-endopeptidase (penicillin-binding protein 4)
MPPRIINLFLCVFSLSAFPAAGQEVQYLQTAFNKFQHAPGLRNASIGLCLMDGDNSKVLFQYQDSISLVPASCLKIVTTASALGLLGPHHRFSTELGYTGTIDKTGALHGDIIITGGGDPTLGSERIESKFDINVITKYIKNAGIRNIDGKIFVDCSYFNGQPVGATWAWNDMGNYFGAGVYSLNYLENIYGIKLQAGEGKGSKINILNTKPANLGLHFTNRLTTGDPYSGDLSNIFSAPGDSFITLDGTLQPSKSPYTIKGSLPDPPALFAKTVAASLFEAGLLKDKNQWEVFSVANPTKINNVVNLDSFKSIELSDIVYFTNQSSINLYAEALVKEIGKTANKSGTRERGINAIKKYWYTKGIDTVGLFMDDGCGLSRYDGISALQLTKILAAISKEPYFDVFLNSLPVSGQSSTMKNMGGSALVGRIYCKTGHMERVRAYSGYIKANSGKWICFSLMVNNYSGNSSQIYVQIEQLLKAMTTVDD